MNQNTEMLAEQIASKYYGEGKRHTNVMDDVKKAIDSATEPLKAEIDRLKPLADKWVKISELMEDYPENTAEHLHIKFEGNMNILRAFCDKYERENAFLVEALEFAHAAAEMTYNNDKKQAFFDKYRKKYANGGCFSQLNIIEALANALTNTTQSALERDKKLREAVIEEAKAKIESIRREVYTTRNMMGSEEWKLQEAYILACNDIVEALTQLKGGE